MKSNQPVQKKFNYYVNIKKVPKQDTEAFPMKNITMIRPKRKKTRKIVGWHQRSEVFIGYPGQCTTFE